jgi:hypothetical protein
MAALSLGGRETMRKFGKAGDLRQKGRFRTPFRKQKLCNKPRRKWLRFYYITF